uniref:Ribosome biogenesis protein NOP53 n=1 Tax=Romanomermis culicivorax TaxID=13658 RepID=A0A915JMM5_ROMCU
MYEFLSDKRLGENNIDDEKTLFMRSTVDLKLRGMIAKKSAAKRISRNKKRYWRKGVDITDVETFKSDQRKEERLGLTEKHDSDLFFIHKDPSDQSGNAKLQSKVTLKSFSNLLPDSAVEAFAEQNRGRKATKRREALKEKKLRAKNSTQNKSVSCNEEKICDLWEESSRKYDYLSSETEVAYLRSTKRILPKVPTCSRIATTALKPVASPHPGQSYNPKFEDHQDLLSRAVLEEAKKIDVVEKLKKRLTPKGDVATEAIKFAEACEGLDLFTKVNNLRESDDDEDVLDNEDKKPDLEKLKPLIAKIDSENRKTRKIEGNLMEDRYRSILKRNIVEVRNPKRNKGRKYKLKKYQKPGVDEVTVDYVPR